jgi:hypothetical protein
MRPFFGLVLCVVLTACADFPQFEEANRGAGPIGPPPPLLPFDALEAATAGDPTAGQAFEGLEARADALRIRAAILRQPLRADDDIDRLRAELDRAR